jgi:phage tail sheath protein FI
MLPNVKVSVTEEVTNSGSTLNTFLPLVILKTKTGPIGTENLISSAKAFTNLYGTPDSSTPSAFGLLQYIGSYGNAYVVRVAGSTAKTATGKITSGSTDLISIETNYKTDLYNGIDVSLVNDTTSSKLYLSATLNGSVVTSVKENFTYTSATAVTISEALTKIVSSFNDAQSQLKLTNLFINKTTEDTKPATFTTLTGSITGGVSGNTGISDDDVTSIIANYAESDLGIDAILAPDNESLAVVSALVKAAEVSSFIAIASITGSTATSILSVASTYPASSSLALYADNVYLTADTTIQVPTSVAVLPAYITKNQASKWLAPAGVTRSTLSLVSSLVNKFSDSDLESLYTNNIPVNGIKKISGTGYVVWGQKTTSQESTQYMDRINVVRLIKYLTKEVYKISYDYLFEPITDYTYNAWTLRVEALLEDIKSGNGLSDYIVQMDNTLNTEETKKANKLIGLVKFKPLEAAEYIEISFVVTDNVNEGSEA